MNEDYLSEKICCYTIKIRKKIILKRKQVFIYGQLFLFLGNGLNPIQAIGLPILPTTPVIMRSIHSTADFSKKEIITQVIKEMPAKMDFIEREIDQLYNISVEFRNNSLSQEWLITKISNLRGGSTVDVVGSLAIVAAIIILDNEFQPNPHVIVLLHLQ